MKLTFFVTILIVFACSKYATSQTISTNPVIQDSLSLLSSKIWKQKTDSAKLTANDIFFKKFRKVLESGIFNPNLFDSIQGVTKIATEDSKLCLFTWNVPLADGTSKYFGFIKPGQPGLPLILLQSTAIDQDNFETRKYSPESWYGAVYYKLIEVKIGKSSAYTLLGWDGYSATSNRKMIDILYFDNQGNAVFGMPVFKTANGIQSRIILEYAEQSNMLLRYDYQSIMVEKRNKLKKVNLWLIVMDRLIPMDPSLKGTKKHYVPAGDIYDGYIFQDGYWVMVEDVNAANKEIITK